jgi:hypothetical protein
MIVQCMTTSVHLETQRNQHVGVHVRVMIFEICMNVFLHLNVDGEGTCAHSSLACGFPLRFVG